MKRQGRWNVLNYPQIYASIEICSSTCEIYGSHYIYLYSKFLPSTEKEIPREVEK